MRSHRVLPVLLAASVAAAQASAPETQIVASVEHQLRITWQPDRLLVVVLDAAGEPVAVDGLSGLVAILAQRPPAGTPRGRERTIPLVAVAAREGEPEHLEAQAPLGVLAEQGLVRVRVELSRAGEVERCVAFWRDGKPFPGACVLEGAEPGVGPHGGLLAVANGRVYEVVYRPDRVRMWVFDPLGQPLRPSASGDANMRVERAGGTAQERLARMSFVKPNPKAGRALGYLEAEHALGDGQRIVVRGHIYRDGVVDEFQVVLQGCTPSWSWTCPQGCPGGPWFQPGLCPKCGRVLRR